MYSIRTILFMSALIIVSAAHAKTYHPFKQFSIRQNPAGTWSYVAAGALLSNKSAKCNGIAKDYCWTNGGSGFPNVAAAEANETGTAINYADVNLPAGYLALDPEGIASVAFQWTAPAAGKVLVSGNFLGVATDEGAHEVAVLHNGAVLVMFTIASYQQQEFYSMPVKVAAGDTISFTSFTGNGGGALTTALQARIVLK